MQTHIPDCSKSLHNSSYLSGLYIIGSSPFTFPAEEGVTRVKVLPDPAKCRGTRRPYVFELAD